MCKELDERNTQENIDLGFNTFCELTKATNLTNFLRVGYISLQYNTLISRGGAST